MPRTVNTLVYKYDELDDRAKERAREWWTQSVFSEPYDWEGVYEDAATIADLFGLDIRQRRVSLMNGTLPPRYEPSIWFSGFSSQGDGACFEGDYRYKKGGLKAVIEHAPLDKELHSIVTQLYEVQRKNFYKLHAWTKHRGHYYHSGCMSVEVDNVDDPYRKIIDEDDLIQALREFADWIYKRLNDEYDYQTSDEVVEEIILDNEYEFTEEGERA